MRDLISIVESFNTPTTLYHIAPVVMRDSISQEGLVHPMDLHQSWHETGLVGSDAGAVGIYFTDIPDASPEFDCWEVDVRGLQLEPDQTTDVPEGQNWFVTYRDRKVDPSRLKLIHRGVG